MDYRYNIKVFHVTTTVIKTAYDHNLSCKFMVFDVSATTIKIERPVFDCDSL